MNPRYALLGACMMHVEGFYSTTSRSFRDRNEGNIENPDGTMKVFPTLLDGFVALVDDIQANAGKTLSSFIAKYAPPNENNTSMYLEVVSKLSGIGEQEIL